MEQYMIFSHKIYYATIALCLNIQWLKEVNEVTPGQTRTSLRKHHRHRIDKYLDTLLANQPISDGEATDRCKSLRRKMADCPS